ncbi:sugar transferase [Bradyrhizobium sp. WSM471]|uniref:sugar transferase n=1 Tax=Bradyrhizobium sp. WSM471 TaxID=319017 RepID=UPI00024D2C2D|nr:MULTISPECIES: sugar transferase [Bradyrhizobium]EHR04632.1 glycosyl transferase possibly involved in lipopolysaccharide synthesis [Bradyrhizobium sp. WSM471]UFW39780.1 sugar transferase [Bradyrhizobium canariense]
MKILRLLDILIAGTALLLAGPLLVASMFLIWCRDRHSPFYVSDRVGQDGRLFRMIKLRSMEVGADRTGVDSTSRDDERITPVGRLLRRLKLDELPQLWNVLKGEMSLVGPRPNVKRETDLYSPEERRLLTLAPGITDLASIVFSDEGDVLSGSADPDLAYNQLIRPWKSRLGLLYIDHCGLELYCKILFNTAIGIMSRRHALAGVNGILRKFRADPVLIEVAHRRRPLDAAPPPGMSNVVTSRQPRRR